MIDFLRCHVSLKHFFSPVFFVALTLLPVFAYAQNTPDTFKKLVNVFLQIITFHLIPLLFALVFVFFMWKTIDAWVLNVGDEKKRSEGKSYVIAAIIFFVLAVSFWGLVRIFASSFFGT